MRTAGLRLTGRALVGQQGDGTGQALATLIGVTRTARNSVNEAVEYLSRVVPPDVYRNGDSCR
jgi:hypothetical protein